MDFWDVIGARGSVRAFTGDDVPAAVVDRLLHAAVRSPSAGNRQPWRFYVVRRQPSRQALADAAFGQEFVAQAPVAIVVCAEPGRSAERYRERGLTLYCLQDTAAAAMSILLAAAAEGLGGCWVGAFDEEEVARALELPAGFRPVAILPIGKPAEPLGQSPRRPVDEVVVCVS